MNKSSKMVPFAIVLSLVIVVASVVMIKQISPGALNGYDVFGLSDLRTDRSVTDPQASDGVSSMEVELEKPTPSDPGGTLEPGQVIYSAPEVASGPEQSEIQQAEEPQVEPEISEPFAPSLFSVTGQDGASGTLLPSEKPTVPAGAAGEKPTANEIEFNKTYIRTIEQGQEADKIKFFTSNKECDYRINLKTKISNSPIYGTITVAIYDERDVIVDKQDVQPNYYSDMNYCDEFNVDFHLQESKNYTLKISGDNLVGDYQIAVFQRDRDAGYSKETAKPIDIGGEITAAANSKLSDWFVCNIEETARYEITFHNINTGSRLYVTGIDDVENGLFSIGVGNEDSKKSYFFAREGERIFIEVNSDMREVDGTYNMLLSKRVD